MVSRRNYQTPTPDVQQQRPRQLPGPILKWAGGKSQLLPTISQFLPETFGAYHEPFMGGGAVFFHLYSKRLGLRARLSDLNDELINCYEVVRDDVGALIKHLKKHINERDYYYEMRAKDPAQMRPVQRASRLIYLNKTCFNGLYRVNSRGQFNVPFGAYKNPRTCDEQNLIAASAALRKASLYCRPFEEALKDPKSGDFVYLDPPYQPISSTANFTSYTARCFGSSDQERLAASVRKLDSRGVLFMMSNSDNEFIRELYKGFRIETVHASRAINCRGDKRGKITEVLIMNY